MVNKILLLSHENNEIMPSAATWMDLEITILSEVSQTEKENTVYHLYVKSKKKNDTNELIYKTEIDSQTQRTNLRLPKGKQRHKRDKLGVWDQQIQTTIYKIDKQQGPSIQHRELSSMSCNNLYRKESEKEYIYMYVCTYN